MAADRAGDDPVTWFQICLAVLAPYMLVGLLVAIARITAHDMPWQLFVFTIIFWPSLWL